MCKKNLPLTNNFCPQSLFLYGTYKEDGTPNFGLFSWMSYLWNGELGVMACIGGEKLTKDRIRATGVFSANLVTESILPLADYFGNKNGYEAGKTPEALRVSKGSSLNVPLLDESPVNFELEVFQTIPLDDGDVFLCKIRNVAVDEALAAEGAPVAEALQAIAPVQSTCCEYFSWSGQPLGPWGEPMKQL